MNGSFWKGRRVFLTGHTGFKGSWLSVWLQRLGAEVTGFALPARDGASLFRDARVAAGMNSEHGDIRNPEALATALKRADPEIVLHMAAQALVHDGYREPILTLETNVMGTAHLLEAVRGVPGVRAVVSVTSDKCYRNVETGHDFREEDPLGGKDPYSGSKACADLVTTVYRESYFGGSDHPAAVGTARAGNVLGGGDWSTDRLVPDLVRAFQDDEPVRIRRPHAVRPWQHVLEPLRGYLTLAERLVSTPDEASRSWNFGPRADDARPVEWIVERAVRHWGGGARWQVDSDDFPPEAGLLRLDCHEASAHLGWDPVLPLEEGLAWTLDWYQAAARGDDMRAFTEAQLARYEERL